MRIDIFNKALEQIAKGAINWESNIKVMLLNSSHGTDVVSQSFVGDVSGNEISGGGYSRKSLAPTVYIETERAVIGDLDDTVWSSLTASNIRHAVIFKDTGNNATSPLLYAIDFEQNFSPSAQNFTIFWRLGILARISKGYLE